MLLLATSDRKGARMGKIDGTIVWTYTAEGIVPPGTNPAMVEGIVRASVSWGDTMLLHLRGTQVRVETLTPEMVAKRLGKPPMHLA